MTERYIAPEVSDWIARLRTALPPAAARQDGPDLDQAGLIGEIRESFAHLMSTGPDYSRPVAEHVQEALRWFSRGNGDQADAALRRARSAVPAPPTEVNSAGDSGTGPAPQAQAFCNLTQHGRHPVVGKENKTPIRAVRVTHEDRLARFGTAWLRRLLAAHGATVEALRPKAQGVREEFLADFISLVTTFAGCRHGMRSAAARKRLLAESGTSLPRGSC